MKKILQSAQTNLFFWKFFRKNTFPQMSMPFNRSYIAPQIRTPAKKEKFSKLESEMPNSDSDWDYPLTDEDLQAIDSAFSSAAASAPPPKRQARSNSDDGGASIDSPPKIRRRLPDSLFVFQQQQKSNINISTFSFSPCSRNRFYSSRNNSNLSPFQGNCSFTFIFSILI